ncbi:MAG: amidase [Hyphomicrobiales bacterium]|nr:amidase [Hyphomicrobiales bacterium]MCP5374203.1 amidase [Hyphomicrobiales bacterium]
MTDNPALLSAVELVDLYARGDLSPVAAAEAALARIEEVDGTLNAFCLVDRDGALAAARESEARWRRGEPCGRIDGVPTTVKDVVWARGWPTGWGSSAAPDAGPQADDAPSVARLRAHGAVLLGKTTSPEFGWKGVTDAPRTGITRNPWNPDKTPGGSSGGAAAAAATGMGALHIGTDGGGSVRIPAGFTGIVGLKPSFGRVPAFPTSKFGSLAHVGPMARTVADAALMLTVMAEPDPRDWTAIPSEGRDYLEGLDDGVAGLRIGWCTDIGLGATDPEITALVEAAVAVFAGQGATVEKVSLDLSDAAAVFRVLWYAGTTRIMAMLPADRHHLVDPGLREVAAEAATYSLDRYMDAMDARFAIGQRMKFFHTEYDLLLTPTLPIPAFTAGEELSDPASQERWPDWTPFTYPFNLTQQPAASVPCGLTSAGLPAGLQVVGPMFDDALVLRACRAYERVHPAPLPAM